jgi:hypothetical protein
MPHAPVARKMTARYVREIAASAYRFQRELDAGERVMVGVNRYATPQQKHKIPLLRIDEHDALARKNGLLCGHRGYESAVVSRLRMVTIRRSPGLTSIWRGAFEMRSLSRRRIHAARATISQAQCPPVVPRLIPVR